MVINSLTQPRENTELTLNKLNAELVLRTQAKLVQERMHIVAINEKNEKLHKVVATEKLLNVANALMLAHLDL